MVGLLAVISSVTLVVVAALNYLSSRATLQTLQLGMDWFGEKAGGLNRVYANLVEELSQLAPIYVSCYPNAGLPNPLSETGFDATPESMAPILRVPNDFGSGR